MSLRVLLTNITLATRSGTEFFVRDLALGLLRRGHRPAVYTLDPGSVAEEIAAAGIEVVSDLDRLETRPEIVHGHHSVPLMTALTHFSSARGIFVVHDRVQWTDAPPRHPRLLHYVAVDDRCRERFAEAGLPPEVCSVILNAVDLERFAVRLPLPPRPLRALLFSNYANEGDVVRIVREACTRRGIALDTAGALIGGAHPRPEEILPAYDLVFGKARCVLEALAVGCAAVICDVAGIGGLVTPESFARLRRLNFGRATQLEPVSRKALEREIDRYDADSCGEVSRLTRADASLDGQVKQFESLYGEVLARPEVSRDPERELRALAEWLPHLLPPWREWTVLWHERERFRSSGVELEAARSAIAERDAEIEALRAALVRATQSGAKRPVWHRLLGRRALPAPMPIIVGAPRSGTTLLRLMLDAHPVLAIPPETGFVAPIAVGSVDASTPETLADVIVAAPAWPDFHLSEAVLRRHLAKLEPFAVTEGLRTFYRLYALRFGKPRWGEKTPEYGLHAHAIAALLPEARFLHLVRDGRDVAVSLREQWFAPGRDMATLARYWSSCIESTRRSAASLGSRYLEVRYEDLIENTAGVLRRICDLCELPFDPRMLSYHVGAGSRLAEHEARFADDGSLLVSKERRLEQQEWSARPPDTARIGRFRTVLSSDECAEFEAVAGPLLRELGYTS